MIQSLNKMLGNESRLKMCTLFDPEILLTGIYSKRQSEKHTEMSRKEALPRKEGFTVACFK